MNERNWEKFFELVAKIVELPAQTGRTWQEMRDEVLAQASANVAEDSFEEFVGWFTPESV
jgi:hypothetical protein